MTGISLPHFVIESLFRGSAAPREPLSPPPRHLAAMADHYRGLGGKALRYLGAQLRAAHGPADDQRARRADIDGVEMLQAFDELGRLKTPVPADVHAPQQHHQRHEPLCL